MTPARLHALLDVHAYIHDEARNDKPRRVSKNPASDLAALANM